MPARLLPIAVALAALLGLAAADDPKEADPPAASPEATADADAKTSEKSAEAKADAKAKPDADEKPKFERATFGGGCFWCLEAVFERIEGVKNVVSGYAGGRHSKPTYPLVCSGLTGHAEVVQIEFDPEVVSYETLLEVFWHCHDPTTLNRQGPDEGTQYRSIILYHSEDQRQAAIQSYREITRAGVFAAPIVTQLVPLKRFYPAERHHQDYFRRYTTDPYCQAQIVPKLYKLGLLKP